MLVEKFVQPKSLDELRSALSELPEGGKAVAGGTDLMVAAREKGLDYPMLISLVKVPELKGISLENRDGEEYLVVGACTCYSEIAASEPVMKYAKALAVSSDHVGSLQIRNRGTIGGSLGNNSVGGDMLPVMYLLEAEIETFGPEGNRFLTPDEFTAGIGRTNLMPQEIIKAIHIPMKPERKSCFVKLGGRREVTIAEISLMFSWVIEDEIIKDVRGILGAVDARPIVLPEADELLGQGKIDEAACDALYERLSERIKTIRMNRKRPPKLRIREGEKEYKERAVKGVVYDAVDAMLLESGK